MTLTENRDVDHYVDQELSSFQMAAGAHVFKHALVGVAESGYARPLVGGDKFAGIAYEEMDNKPGTSGDGGADGDRCLRVYTLGDFGLQLLGAHIANIGQPVFASADDVLTFERDGTSYVGIMQDFVQKDEIVLRLATLAAPPK